MKTLIMVLGFAAFTHVSFAQCDQKVLLKFNKLTENKNGQPGTPSDVTGSVDFAKDKIIITAIMGGSAKTIESNITKVAVCSWKTFLKDGKAQYQTLSRKGNEGPFDPASIEVESVNGITKVIFTPPSNDGTSIQFDIVASETESK
jgi:hypothetical protein